MSLSTLEVKALRDVANKIKARLQDEYTHAGKGTGADPANPVATGCLWIRRAAFISGLEAALLDCQAVEDDLSGAAPPKKKPKE